MFQRTSLLALAIVSATYTGAAAAPSIDRVFLASRVGDANAASDGPAEARAGETITLYAVVVVKDGKQRLHVTTAPALTIRGRRVATIQPQAFPVPLSFRWSTVEPVPNHADAQEPYSNAVLGGDNHGKWSGFDKVTYFETPLGPWSSAWTRPGSARPPRPADDIYEGLGTMRYKVEARDAAGHITASPGAEATDKYGLTTAVMRVSVRKGDDFLGWLSSFFLVPEIFGSSGPGKNHQTDRYVGSDCADILVGALRAGGSKLPYTSAAGLRTVAKHISGPFNADAQGHLTAATPQTPAPIQAGDLVLIRYAGEWATGTGRAWDHVGAIWQDKGTIGVLDGEDLIIHMGHPRLEIEPLKSQSPAVFDVLRWNPKKTR